MFVIVYATTLAITNPATQCLHKQTLEVVQTLSLGTLGHTNVNKCLKEDCEHQQREI